MAKNQVIALSSLARAVQKASFWLKFSSRKISNAFKSIFTGNCRMCAFMMYAFGLIMLCLPKQD